MLILHNIRVNKDKNFALLHLSGARRQHKHLPEELVRAEDILFSINHVSPEDLESSSS